MVSPASSARRASRLGKWYKRLTWREDEDVDKENRPLLGSKTHPARMNFLPSPKFEMDQKLNRSHGIMFLANKLNPKTDESMEEADIFDQSPINIADCDDTLAIRRIRDLLFQLYCMTAQCSICLGALGSNAQQQGFEFGKDLEISVNGSSLLLCWQPDEKLGVDSMTIGCLPCGHFFCRGCLDGMVKVRAHTLYGSLEAAPEKLRIRCPLCRKKVKCTNVCNIST